MAEKSGKIRVSDAREIAKAVRRLSNIPHSEEGIANRLGGSSGRFQSIITIVNNTAQTLETFSVVKLNRDVTKTIAASEDISIAIPVWEATIPDGEETAIFGVLQSKVPPGLRGEALVLGMTKVRLDDTQEGILAGPVEDSFDKMETSGIGRYPVLVVAEEGSSSTWGIILLCNNDIYRNLYRVTELVNEEEGTVKVQAVDLDGNPIGEETEVNVAIWNY